LNLLCLRFYVTGCTKKNLQGHIFFYIASKYLLMRVGVKSIVILVCFIISCTSSKYAATNKIYRQQVKSFARQLRQAPLKDSFATNGPWVGTTNFGMRKPNFVIIHHTAQNSCDQTLQFRRQCTLWDPGADKSRGRDRVLPVHRATSSSTAKLLALADRERCRGMAIVAAVLPDLASEYDQTLPRQSCFQTRLTELCPCQKEVDDAGVWNTRQLPVPPEPEHQ